MWHGHAGIVWESSWEDHHMCKMNLYTIQSHFTQVRYSKNRNAQARVTECPSNSGEGPRLRWPSARALVGEYPIQGAGMPRQIRKWKASAQIFKSDYQTFMCMPFLVGNKAFPDNFILHLLNYQPVSIASIRHSIFGIVNLLRRTNVMANLHRLIEFLRNVTFDSTRFESFAHQHFSWN